MVDGVCPRTAAQRHWPRAAGCGPSPAKCVWQGGRGAGPASRVARGAPCGPVHRRTPSERQRRVAACLPVHGSERIARRALGPAHGVQLSTGPCARRDRAAARAPGAHEARERALAPLQTQLLAYTSHAVEVREWFYWPGEGGAGERAGPLTKDEIKHHFHRGRARARGLRQRGEREGRRAVTGRAGLAGHQRRALQRLRLLYAQSARSRRSGMRPCKYRPNSVRVPVPRHELGLQCVAAPTRPCASRHGRAA